MEQGREVPVKILGRFDIPGTLVSLEELKRGHINRTYIGHWDVKGERRKFVHQSVNFRVFPDIEALMGNLALVTERVRADIAARGAEGLETTLKIIPTNDGAAYVTDEAGEYWRTFEYIGNTVSYDVCSRSSIATEAAAILGRFQRALSGLDPRSLRDTIPYFHHGVKRFESFARAVKADPKGRVKEARSEIDFAFSREVLAGALISPVESGEIPLRVSHNDMKLNNVLFDARGERAVCLLDLDTCMAGTPLFDFGDLVRNTAVPCAEDEQDFSKVVVDTDLYKAICEGYLHEVGEMLTSEERKLLPVAPRVLALILGVRFLMDYLEGDHYFRIHRSRQNLERARTQFQVVRAFEACDASIAGLSA